jgi:glycosyltransferase involved in cell wall biosynthesis
MLSDFDHQLTPLEASRHLPETGFPLVLVARNEGLRLPFLLTYYRQKGVSRFYVVDDHSTDGSRESLLAQPDCAVFSPLTRYAEADCGLLWQKALLDAYCRDQWTLVVDADELFIYPHDEQLPLAQLCAHLDRAGKTAMAAFLLDMYPEGPLSQAHAAPGQPFWEVCPFFDDDYRFVNRFSAYLPFGAKAQPSFEVIGGPRQRLFYPNQHSTGLGVRLASRLVWRAAKLAQRCGLPAAVDRLHPAPALHKAPLVKWNGKLGYASAHTVVGARMAEERGALLHFKFFADFHTKAVEEARRGEHFMGGQEYKRYLGALQKNPEIAAMNGASRRYRSSDDVLAAGLMRSSSALDAAVAK